MRLRGRLKSILKREVTNLIKKKVDYKRWINLILLIFWIVVIIINVVALERPILGNTRLGIPFIFVWLIPLALLAAQTFYPTFLGWFILFVIVISYSYVEFSEETKRAIAYIPLKWSGAHAHTYILSLTKYLIFCVLFMIFLKPKKMI